MRTRFVVMSCAAAAWLAAAPGGAQAAPRNVVSELLTAAGQADMQRVVQMGREDLSRAIQEQLAAKAAAIRETREGWKAYGVEAGANYEITLAPGVCVSVAAEDLPALAAWDGKSTPTFPFDFKAKHENEVAGKEASVEIHYNPASPQTFGIESIQFEGKQKTAGVGDRVTVKISGTPSDPVVEVDYGKGVSTSKALKDATGLEFEAEQSIGLDSKRKAGDYYTEDMERSDWWIVRTVEDFVAKIKWGVSGSAGHEKELEGGDKLVTKVKYTFGTDTVRDWWTDWLFADADHAAQQLDEQLTHMDKWRRNRIEQEAKKWGIDPAGKNNGQLIQEVGAARRDAGVTDPVFGPKGGGGSGAAAGGPGLLPPPIQPPAGGAAGGSGAAGGGVPTLQPFR